VPEVQEPESEPQRFNFHRVLLNAASRGLTEVAEDTIEQMRSSDLPPGPRAYHALVFSYVRANLPYEALDTAARAADEDVRLLPETFVVLIYAMLNYARPPDVEKAKMVLESMEAQEGLPAEGGTGEGGAAGWTMLCTELFRKGLIADAMKEVKQGNEKGYVTNPELAKHVIEQLSLAGLKEEAWQELASLVALGYQPGPDQYRHLIRAEAATGDWNSAHHMLTDALSRPDWLPPNAEAFNSLLQGIVASINPDKGRIPSSLGEAAEEHMAEGLEGDTQSMAESLEVQFGRLREEMLVYGFRPNAVTYATMCEGYIKLRDIDAALASLQSMRDAGGSTQLISKKWMSALLISLAKGDRPMDLLNVLKSLVSANQRLPKAASKPIVDGTAAPGATIATVWLPAHFEYMRTHKDRGDGGGGGAGGISSAASGLRALMDQALELRDVGDGIQVSNLGNCVVENDGSGIWVKPARMTTAEMQAELTAAGIPLPPSGKRRDFTAAVKAHRDSLPRNVKDIQEHLEQARKAEMEALERKTGLLLGQPVKPKKKGKVEVDTFRVLQMEDGKLRKILHVSQEVIKGSRSNYSRSVGGSNAYDEDLDLVLSGGRPNRKGADDDGPDEVDDILSEGVDEGVGEIIKSTDNIFGDSGDVPTVQDEVERDTFDLTIDFLEAKMLNKSAGMSVAFEVMKSMEMLGGNLSGPDFEALVMGTVTEENVEVALELSQRLPRLLSMGYEAATVASLYERLVRMCLGVLRGASADLILERAEDAGLQVDPSLYVLLNKALAGRPRHRDLEKAEVEEMVEDPGVANILGDDQEAVEAVQGAAEEEEEEEEEEEDEGEEEEEGEGEEQQQSSQQQDIDQVEPPSNSHVFSFGADLLQQLDEEDGALDVDGMEGRVRQSMGLPPLQLGQQQQQQLMQMGLQQRIDLEQQGATIDAEFEDASASSVEDEGQEAEEDEHGLQWSLTDELLLSPLGGKATIVEVANQLSRMLEAKLGSAAAAEEAMQRVLGSEEGAAAGAEALVAEGLITQEDLELVLTGALALGMGAVTPEEREAFMQGQLPEENVQMMSHLTKLLGEEPLAQVMSGMKHPAEFAHSEEDAERLHELLDRYITAAGDQSEQLEDGGEGESEEAGDAGMGEDEGGSRSRRSADRNGNGGSGVMSSEEALQVARLLPNPSEGGLASFFEHLSYTQVERVRQTLERQYSDPTWLAQRARRQHKRELVLAGLELGQMKEGEVDEGEVDRLLEEQDKMGVLPIVTLPRTLSTDQDVKEQVELFASEALAQEPLSLAGGATGELPENVEHWEE